VIFFPLSPHKSSHLSNSSSLSYLSMSDPGTADVQAELQDYLNSKNINTLFIQIVESLLIGELHGVVTKKPKRI